MNCARRGLDARLKTVRGLFLPNSALDAGGSGVGGGSERGAFCQAGSPWRSGMRL